MHKDKTENLISESHLNEFISLSDHRYSVFVKFE